MNRDHSLPVLLVVFAACVGGVEDGQPDDFELFDRLTAEEGPPRGCTKSQLFDIFFQAAPEILANLPSRPECQIAGVGVQLFNAENHCMAEGITCLIGMPASAGDLELCNLTVTRAADVESGKRIAVAALLAASHTCE